MDAGQGLDAPPHQQRQQASQKNEADDEQVLGLEVHLRESQKEQNRQGDVDHQFFQILDGLGTQESSAIEDGPQDQDEQNRKDFGKGLQVGHVVGLPVFVILRVA